ncbi:Uncharacterised protein [Escherichia coli]|nr:Uncharacterised protein [Escherichia coli]
MAIEGAAATVPLRPGERLNGLNHIAELRAKVFGLNIESELERFIKDMRDPRISIMNKINGHWLPYSLWQKFQLNVIASALMS